MSELPELRLIKGYTVAIFFGFGGRLNRQPFLILCFALLGIYMVSSLVLVGVLGAIVGGITGVINSGNLQEFSSTSAGASLLMGAVLLVFFLAVFISSLSLCVRRLHDRDKSGWWLAAYYLAGFILTGLGFLLASNGSITGYLIVTFIQIVIGFWLFVELCFMRGTNGPNQFGSDPLSGSVADAEIFT